LPIKNHDAQIPSIDEILAFIERESQLRHQPRIGSREVARAFGLKGEDRLTIKRILKELVEKGALEKQGKLISRKNKLPPVALVEIIERDRDGELLAIPVEWDEEELGFPPKILIHAPRRAKTGQPLPGVNDRVLARAELNPDAGPKDPPYLGRVIKILPRARNRILGILNIEANGSAHVAPIDKKQLGRQIVIAPNDIGPGKHGDLVSIDQINKTRARVKETLGSVTSEKALSLIAIRAHDIPDIFKDETILEAKKAQEANFLNREDWRELPFITIDPPDAKDHDDAVYAVLDQDHNNEGGYILCVAIADVAYYVKPRSSLDRDALDRGNSVYFPDRVVPMLPERISNDLCSLKAHEDRPALAVKLRITAQGKKIDHVFHRVMIRSRAKLSYSQAQEAVDGRTDDITANLLNVLRPLFAAHQALQHERRIRAPLELDLPERKILLKPDGSFDRVIIPPRLEAHRLIEEFMILANVAAAETLEAHRQQLIYRAHDEPSREKINALSEFLATIGVKLSKGQVLKPANFNTILARLKGMEHENIVNEIVLRTQAQAEYTHENYGHFGLNLRRYAHFTSPIRRYADLIVHRALIRALNIGEGALPETSPQELAEVAARISAAERRAMAAERETVDRLIAHHLISQIGAQFQARISGVTRAGLFVRLSDTGADGFVPAATLGREYYAYDERAHALSARSGVSYRLADHIIVKLVEAAPIAGALRFEVVEGGVKRPPSKNFTKTTASKHRKQIRDNKIGKDGQRRGRT
jgi:ribonuclease R